MPRSRLGAIGADGAAVVPRIRAKVRHRLGIGPNAGSRGAVRIGPEGIRVELLDLSWSPLRVRVKPCDPREILLRWEQLERVDVRSSPAA